MCIRDRGKDQSMNAEPYDPQHACVVVHTGGTTGSPKGVMLDVYKRQLLGSGMPTA